jgi:hypothetical protein
MATVSVEGDTISLDLPVRVPDLTLRITGESIAGVAVDGRPLRRATSRRDFGSESAWVTPEATYVAFTPSQRITTIALQIGHGT